MNDATVGLMAPTISDDQYSIFVVGGKEIKIPPPTLWDLERSKDLLFLAGTDDTWVGYAARIVRLLVRLREESDSPLDYEALMKACSPREALNLAPAYGDFLVKAGFMTPGEREAAMAGTISTLPASPPNSLPEESSSETNIPSNGE